MVSYLITFRRQVDDVRSVIGVYCMIFSSYWQIQLKRADRRKGLPTYALTVNFILITMYFIITIIQTQFDITVSHTFKMS